MTENEMRKRMKEIDKKREELKSEKQKYENYFINKEMKAVLNNHIKFEGKCFFTKNLSNNKHEYIKAFKILNVLSEPNENYAECISIVDGYRSSCWNEFGTQIMTLPLWTPNTSRLMNKESDSKMIDMYEEITQENFNSIYIKYKKGFEDKMFR